MTTTIEGRELDHADLVELLWEFNVDAKTLSRRGWCGTGTVEYADCHAAINDVLDRLVP